MSDFDLDRLIDQFVMDAQLANGEDPTWMHLDEPAMRSVPMAAHRGESNRNHPKWTPDEDEFIQANIGQMGIAGVAQALGRSENAIKIRIVRSGHARPSRVPGWLTGNQAALLLGLDGHKVCFWIDHGMMPGERCAWSQRVIRRVRIVDLKIWLLKPETWIYVRPERITHAGLRRLVLLARDRWGDEWWNMRQAADFLGCDTKDVQRQIKLGRLSGIQAKYLSGRDKANWSLWFTRRSHIEKLRIPRGKGSGRWIQEWSPRADAFMLQAKAEGKTYAEVARMMGWKEKRVTYRIQCLRRQAKQ